MDDMIAALADALLWPLIGLLGVLAGGVVAMWQRDKRKASDDRADKAEGYINTRKRIDETNLGDDPDVLRDWLRDRDPNKR